jgi:hypothetical protein
MYTNNLFKFENKYFKPMKKIIVSISILCGLNVSAQTIPTTTVTG